MTHCPAGLSKQLNFTVYCRFENSENAASSHPTQPRTAGQAAISSQQWQDDHDSHRPHQRQPDCARLFGCCHVSDDDTSRPHTNAQFGDQNGGRDTPSVLDVVSASVGAIHTSSSLQGALHRADLCPAAWPAVSQSAVRRVLSLRKLL